jgi:uncharacterized membrane protein YqjE
MTESSGLMGSLQRLTATLLAILRTRLDLFSSEMEEERLRIEQRLLYGSITLFFFAISILLLTLFIVVFFWDNYRLQMLGGFTALFLLAGLITWNALRKISREKPKLFSVCLATLADDCDLLSPRI